MFCALVSGVMARARLPIYVAEMLKRGMHEAELAKLIGGNFLRVFGEVEAK